MKTENERVKMKIGFGLFIILFCSQIIFSQSLFVCDSFTLSDYPGINQEVTVTCSFIPAQNEDLVIAKIILPSKAKFISGDSIWTGSTMQGHGIKFSANIIFSDTGNVKIQLSVKKKYDGTKWAGNTYSHNLFVGLKSGHKGWNYYYNETERKLIKMDSAGFFNRMYLEQYYFIEDTINRKEY